MALGLQGKLAIVTGGSRGIGKAIARELAREFPGIRSKRDADECLKGPGTASRAACLS